MAKAKSKHKGNVNKTTSELPPEVPAEVTEVRAIYTIFEINEGSASEFLIDWFKAGYALKDKHFLKEKTLNNGQKVWIFDEIIECDIAPFKALVSGKNKLPATTFVQYLQAKFSLF